MQRRVDRARITTESGSSHLSGPSRKMHARDTPADPRRAPPGSPVVASTQVRRVRTHGTDAGAAGSEAWENRRTRTTVRGQRVVRSLMAAVHPGQGRVHVLLTPEPEACVASVRGGQLGTLLSGGGVLEDILLQRVLSFLHLHDIATIGPTVSRAWQRCVAQHCYPQLMAPGREVEVWTSVLTDAGHADQPAPMRAYVVVPPQVGSSCTFSVPPAPGEAATKRAEQELFVKILNCGPHVNEGNSGAPHAVSAVQCVQASAVRPISRVCPAAVERWLCLEAMEGSKPLAMHAATTLAAFLPVCCQRCGALAVQPQEHEYEVVSNNGTTVPRLVDPKSEDVFNAKCRFGARQLRPGVRENLSWMSLEDRRKRLQCISCLILEAGEVGRPSRYNRNFASGSDASIAQDGTALSSSQEKRPSPWLHIDFHTGGGAGSTSSAADGPRKQQVQQALRTREEVCEWLEAHYMGADEFCAALPGSRYSSQPRAEATVATDATIVTHISSNRGQQGDGKHLRR